MPFCQYNHWFASSPSKTENLVPNVIFDFASLKFIVKGPSFQLTEFTAFFQSSSVLGIFKSMAIAWKGEKNNNGSKISHYF